MNRENLMKRYTEQHPIYPGVNFLLLPPSFSISFHSQKKCNEPCNVK